jgi:hypothetical protein
VADEFDTDKGVKDDYVGEITDAFFKGSEQNPDDISLVLVKKAEDGDEPEDYYRVGTDWASFDGGETVEHPSKSKVRADAQIAVLTERAMAAGADEIIRQRSAENGSKGYRTAKLWPGLIFHWTVETKHVNFTNQQTGEKVERDVFKSYPDKFLGVANETQTSPQGVDNSANEEAPPEVIAKLKILAQSLSYADWVDEALTIEYARANMTAALSNESFYNSLKEG